MQSRNSSHNMIRFISIIYYAILSSMLLFLILVLFLNKNVAMKSFSSSITTLLIPLLLVSFISLLSGNLIYKKRLPNIIKENNIEEKLKSFQTISIIKYATFEGPTLFGIVCLLLTNSSYFLAIIALLLTIYLLNRPTRAKILNELQLKENEI